MGMRRKFHVLRRKHTLISLCSTWIDSVTGNHREPTNPDEAYRDEDVENHLQAAHEAVIELQTIWREWVFASESSDHALARVGGVKFYIDPVLWRSALSVQSCKSTMRRYSEAMIYIAAMGQAIGKFDELERSKLYNRNHESEGKSRAEVMQELLPSRALDQAGKIPRSGSTIPDIHAEGLRHSDRYDYLPKL